MHRAGSICLALSLSLVAVAACSSASGPNAGDAGHDDGGPGDGGDASDGTTVDSSVGDDASDGSVRDGSSGDGDAGANDGAFVEAPHTLLPQVPDGGGPILASPQLVTITFAPAADAGPGQGPLFASFGDWIVGSQWLASVGKDYGVGPGAHVMNVVLPGPAPATASDTDTQTLIEDSLMSGVLPSAPLDGGTGSGDAGAATYLYMVVYPPTTTTGSFLGGPSTCLYEGGGRFLGGYHWETQTGPYHVPYAVIPTCTSGAIVEGSEDLEISASHEIIEAATDPFPSSNPAWAITDYNDPWSLTDGEVADLCEGKQTTEAGFFAQRVWSNTAAMGTGDPCIPSPSGEVMYDVAATPTTVQGVAAGSSVTFMLTGFSSAPLPSWSLQAFLGQGTFTPTFTLSSTTMSNGQTATLTVTVPAGTPSQAYSAIYLSSSTSLTDYNDWIVGVAVP